MKFYIIDNDEARAKIARHLSQSGFKVSVLVTGIRSDAPPEHVAQLMATARKESE